MPHPSMTNLATRIAGIIVLIIGLVHFLLPTMGYAPADLAAIPEAQREHFVFLGTYAIGSFLLSFAVMTLMANARAPSLQTVVFLGLMSGVWTLRVVLEIIYPVMLPLFWIAAPHPALLVATLIVTCAYAVGFLGHLRALPAGRRPVTPAGR